MLRYLSGVLGLAGAYYLSAQLALRYGGVAEVNFFWPATGVAVAVLFRAGLRYWPGLVFGALVGARHFPPATAGVLALMVSVGPVLTAWLLVRFRFDPHRLGRRELVVFLAAGLLGVTGTSSAVAVWRAAVQLPAARLAEVWLVWW
ncbi:MAG: MASE1 domain-containing protein, partial [Gemmataceae bacterium]|nr:MASE1 domain-containing protein [Gemmataceae bacterium]